MKFTIAIPTYNNSKTLVKTINSCLLQNYKEAYEVLVVNNASDDNTSEILSSYKNDISIINNKETVSLFENHNVCLRNSKGKYIIFCHSDDELLPHALTNFDSILSQNNYPTKFVLWGRSMFRDFHFNWKNSGFQLNQIVSGIYSLKVFQLGGLTPSGTCYSRKSFLEIGGFLPMLDSKTPSDLTTMWLLCINFFEFQFSDRIFFKREFASTANFNVQNNNEYHSIKNSVTIFKKNISERKFKLVCNVLMSFNSSLNPLIVRALLSSITFSKNSFKLKILKFLIQNPKFLLKRKYIFLLFS